VGHLSDGHVSFNLIACARNVQAGCCDHKAAVCFNVYACFKVGATGDMTAWMFEIEMPAASAAHDGVRIENTMSCLQLLQAFLAAVSRVHIHDH
jgi:hypothetical protein